MNKKLKYNGKKILYFEDQLDKVDDVIYTLEKNLGFHVIKEDSPDKVYTVLEKNGFDLVILDIRIVGGESDRKGNQQDWTRYGVYFLEELRGGKIKGPTQPNVPVLVFSCVVSTADKERIVTIGEKLNSRFKYLEKPTDLPIVEEVVVQLMAN